MNFNDEQNYVTNLKLMKMIGLYQLINPQSSKWFGFNIYKVAATLEIILTLIYSLLLSKSSFHYLDNTKELMNYAILSGGLLISSLKMLWLSWNSESIWNIMDIMTINFLSNKRHKNKEILQTARDNSISTTILIAVLWISVVVIWALPPLLMKNTFMDVKVNNETRRYLITPMKIVYPLSEKFHNEHFSYLIFFEMNAGIAWGHATVAFDIFVISVFIAITFQLKTIADSYSRLCFPIDGVEGNVNCVKENDLEAMFTLKQLIQDQQLLFKKIKKIHTIFGPLLYLQIALYSMTIVLQAFTIFINHYNGHSLVSVQILKIIVTLTPRILHLYIMCYLCDSINEQQNSMNFALYSSNWTGMSTNYKKKMLLCMSMNDATNLKLKISQTKIVNLEMFASVLHFTYSMISVLANSYKSSNTQ